MRSRRANILKKIIVPKRKKKNVKCRRNFPELKKIKDFIFKYSRELKEIKKNQT